MTTATETTPATPAAESTTPTAADAIRSADTAALLQELARRSVETVAYDRSGGALFHNAEPVKVSGATLPKSTATALRQGVKLKDLENDGVGGAVTAMMRNAFRMAAQSILSAMILSGARTAAGGKRGAGWAKLTFADSIPLD